MNEQNYLDSHIDKDEVIRDFPNIEEYEETLRCYLADDFFEQLQEWIQQEDYGMAIDATKGLYILAGELKIFSLYTALIEIYEDLLYEDYQNIRQHAEEVEKIHQNLLKVWKK